MNTLSKIENETITNNSLCECKHVAKIHRDGKECHGLFCHCEGFVLSSICLVCRGRGILEIIDIGAHQQDGKIIDEVNHEEICTNCNGTGKIKDN